jgi:hypothetical protein
MSVLAIVSIISAIACSRDGVSGELSVISAGRKHTCAVSSTGQAICWGYNQLGQVGAQNFFDRNAKTVKSPVFVAKLPPDVVSISAGWEHTCAISATEGPHCWADNEGRIIILRGRRMWYRVSMDWSNWDHVFWASQTTHEMDNNIVSIVVDTTVTHVSLYRANTAV